MSDTLTARATNPNRRLTRIGLAFAIILLLLCVISLAWRVIGITRADEGAVISEYEGMTREEIQAELDRTVRENMMTVSIAPVALLDPNGNLEVNVVNVEDNRFPQRFSVIQNDETVYTSGVIEPGKAVVTCHPDHIETGAASIEIQALDPKTKQDHGSPTRVNITVSESSESQG